MNTCRSGFKYIYHILTKDMYDFTFVTQIATLIIIILYSKSNTVYRYIHTNYKQYMIHYTQYIII